MSINKKQTILDVVVYLLLLVTLLAVYTSNPWPTKFGFWCHDMSIRYPYKDDTVRPSVLLIVGIGIPTLLILQTEAILIFCLKKHPMPSKSELVFTLGKIFGLFHFGLTLTILMTEISKTTTGQPRPCFMELCKPNVTCNMTQPDTFVTNFECTNKNFKEKDHKYSQRSFPSGHASVSSYGATFTVLYLQLRLLLAPRVSYLIRPVLQTVVVMLSLLNCISRVTDYKHFPSDVIGGTVLGTSVGWFVFYYVRQNLVDGIFENLGNPQPQPALQVVSHSTLPVASGDTGETYGILELEQITSGKLDKSRKTSYTSQMPSNAASNVSLPQSQKNSRVVSQSL